MPITQISNPIPGRSIAAGMTATISPTMTNEFNWGFTHNSILIDESGNVLKSNSDGINLPVLYPSAVQENYIPNVTFNGTRISASPGFGSGDAPFINYNTTIDTSDNLTKIWGRHTIKGGVYMQRSRKDQTSFANFNGSYNFGDNPSNPYDSGYGFSNALLGVYNTFNQAANHINGLYRYWNIEGFLEDTWKVTPRVTLDYGIRTAWYQPQYDAGLQSSTFVPSLWQASQAPRLYTPAINPANNTRSAYDATTKTYLPAFDIGLEVPNSGNPFNGICQSTNCPNGKYLMQDRGLQWGPRFGVAWDVTGKQNIVFRAGSGIYYDRIQGNRTFDMVTNPPEAVSPTLNQNLVSSINPNNILLGPSSLDAVDPTGKIPTTYQYQAGFQFRLPQNTSLDVAYVGSESRHLQDNRNINYNPFGQCFLPQSQDTTLAPTSLLGNNCLSANFLKPYRGYGNITIYQSEATSNYNALQVQVQRRATKGLFFGAAYTWSKALGTAQREALTTMFPSARINTNVKPTMPRPASIAARCSRSITCTTRRDCARGMRFCAQSWMDGNFGGDPGGDRQPVHSRIRCFRGRQPEHHRIEYGRRAHRRSGGMQCLRRVERSLQSSKSGVLLRAIARQHGT